MKDYFIDTNIFLRFFIQDSKESFIECKTFLESLPYSNDNFYTSSFVISEIVYTLTTFYKTPKDYIISCVEAINNSFEIKITNDIDQRIATDLFKEYNIKFVDCLIASTKPIYEEKMTIISYDRDFDKLGLKRITPHFLKSNP